MQIESRKKEQKSNLLQSKLCCINCKFKHLETKLFRNFLLYSLPSIATLIKNEIITANF